MRFSGSRKWPSPCRSSKIVSTTRRGSSLTGRRPLHESVHAVVANRGKAQSLIKTARRTPQLNVYAHALSGFFRFVQERLHELGAQALVPRFGNEGDVDDADFVRAPVDVETADRSPITLDDIEIRILESLSIMAMLRVELLRYEGLFLLRRPRRVRQLSRSRARVEPTQERVVFSRDRAKFDTHLFTLTRKGVGKSDTSQNPCKSKRPRTCANAA